MKGFIFDLDGVIVDTAKYHFLAWKETAGRLGFDFSLQDNEKLKGVSRMKSLEILLDIGNINLTDFEKKRIAEEKNNLYVSYISLLTPNDILPGAKQFLEKTQKLGIKTGMGSASKNAPYILEKLAIKEYFDVVVDGNCVSKAKPDPEVFISCAQKLSLLPRNCVVFEDAEAGIEAAHNAQMKVVGIGNSAILKKADLIVSGLSEITPERILNHNF